MKGINAGDAGAAGKLLDDGMTCWKSKATANFHLYGSCVAVMTQL